MKIPKHIRKCMWQVILSALLTMLGIVLLNYHMKLTDVIYNKVLLLKPPAPAYTAWEHPEAEVVIDFYFFNWTNPEDFKNISVKPKFEEVGPYTFHQQYHRVNLTFNENDTLTYRNNKTFHFQEGTGFSLDDKITSLNVISTIAVDKARNWNFFLRRGLSIALNSVPYEATKRADELIFRGYEDSLLKTANYLPFLDDIPSMDKFGWFYSRNGSADYEGVYTIGTGLGNTTLGTLYRWNYKDKGSYPGNCGTLESSIGEIFPQHVKKEKLEYFFADYCRKVVLDFDKTVTWKGIEAYKFVGDISFLDSGTHNPENSCLCPKKCLKFGVVDYSVCKFGVPVYLSFPHFYKADPFFRNDIEGVEPGDAAKHEMFMIVNPRTGIVLEVVMAVQINLYVQPNPEISKFRNIPEKLFPVWWFAVKSEIYEPTMTKLRIFLHLPLILKSISAAIIILGIVSLICVLHLHMKGTHQEKPCKNKLDKDALTPLNIEISHEKINSPKCDRMMY